ncbi:MAG: hypothetical protein K0S65_2752 [Labilithrix sp.]|nr:hypothetical protein [Labilithrix sp.]
MNTGRSLGALALLVVSVAMPLACGSNKQEASFSVNGGSDAGAPPPMQGCQPGQPCPAACPPGQMCPPPPGSAAPLGSVYTTDPNALASLLAAAAAAGSAWLGPAAAIADPAEVGLRAAAAQYAPGMSADGQVAKGNLAEGGHIDFVVNMEPTKCYAVVAYGAGVTDLDVNLLAPPLYNILAGQDGMAGPTAVVGAAPRPMCPILPVTVPYKIDLHAKKGGGLVAAQLYSKAK